jgi:hypothetical protein
MENQLVLEQINKKFDDGSLILKDINLRLAQGRPEELVQTPKNLWVKGFWGFGQENYFLTNTWDSRPFFQSKY